MHDLHIRQHLTAPLEPTVRRSWTSLHVHHTPENLVIGQMDFTGATCMFDNLDDSFIFIHHIRPTDCIDEAEV